MSDLRVSVLLSVQRSLLGMITPNIRGITCGWNDRTIVLRFIYDGQATEDQKEDASVAATEVIADFPDHLIELEIVEIPAPKDFKAQFLDAWSYIRHEER